MNHNVLAPLIELPGVGEAADRVRKALAQAHRHRFNLKNWHISAEESAIRGARSSSALSGGALRWDADQAAPDDPVLAGALRVGQALSGGATRLVAVWQRAPMQALARLHTLAAADLVEDEYQLGRPRQDPEVAARLDLMTRVVISANNVPAPVVAAVAHGEVLALSPFGSGDALVARAVSRLVTITSGLDPHGLGVPEVYWLRHQQQYYAAAKDFASGSPEAITAWLLMCCHAWEAGAREALSIAESGYRS